MCDCFTCANRDDLKACKSYLLGQYQANRSVYNSLKRLGIKRGHLGDEGLSGLFAEVECDMNDSGCLLCSPELRNIKLNGSLAEEIEKQF